MITFYPGPSKVYPQVEDYMHEAFGSGLISANHRSESFMRMLEETIRDLKMKLAVPDNYEVYIVSSATECWEIIAQSVIRNQSLHIFNGAFGEKWKEYTHNITGSTRSYAFDQDRLPDVSALKISSRDEVICITHNETSNGTAVPASFLIELRAQVENVIAVDATSSMAGVEMPWESADIWYASVQKCFGLPAGMGVMIASRRAVAQAEEIGERSHYNSLLFIRDNFLKNQTPYTPNTLGIYLLGKVMKQVGAIREVSGRVSRRASEWYSFLKENKYQLLIENEAVRSETVIAVYAEKERVSYLKKAAKEAGITLGNGYGRDKETSFRIANFPAISDEDISTLKEFLVQESSKTANE